MDNKDETEATMNTDSNGQAAPAIGKAFRILEYLAHAPGGRNLKDIHETLGMPKTSTHSILRALAACAVVKRTPDGLYHPGIKLYTLGVSARGVLETSRPLLPRLQELRDELQQTVFFSLFDNGEQVVWEKADGPGGVLFKAFRGERKRMNTSSAGKAIAAHLPENELNAVLARGMAKATPKSIATPEAFLDHLETVRERGYAVDDEEGEPGVFCIGVPVFARDHLVYGAVSVSTLKSTLRAGDAETYVQALQCAARDLSELL
ncbi:MAG: IclR family transcriptional regulator [Clostridiales bacterium]|nr:IclR family transcriptional regulator [Clostridiales bacterium]